MENIWKTLSKRMIWGYPYFWKHPVEHGDTQKARDYRKNNFGDKMRAYSNVDCESEIRNGEK